MKTIKISAIIIGSIIGAGFASGKEIFEYFAKYGIYSLFFIIPLFFLFSFFIYNYLKFGKNKNINKSKKILNINKKLSIKIDIYNAMLFICFLILCSTMFSGLIALFCTYFPYNLKLIYFFIAIIISVILLNIPFNKIDFISNIIVPLIIVCLILNVIRSFSSGNFCINFGVKNILPLPFLIILYASQNTFLCSIIISKLGEDLTKKQMILISIIVSFVLCLLIIFGILCFLFNPKLIYADMPFAEVAISVNPIFSVVFAVILFGSIITTYVTTLSSLQTFFSSKKKHVSNFIILVLIVLLSLFDFGKIIEYLYPIIGVFGIVYFVRILTNNNSLSFNFSLQKSNEEVHPTSKQA